MNKKWIWEICLNDFSSEVYLQRHLEDCNKLNISWIIMPSQSNKLMKFENFKHELPVSFVIYADIEIILREYDDDRQTNRTNYQKHEAFSIAYYFKSHYDNRVASKFRKDLTVRILSYMNW